jgi:hypothetical protein
MPNFVPINPVLADTLKSLQTPRCLVDEDGRILGTFFPAGLNREFIDLTPEQFAMIVYRRSNPGRTYTTNEVLAHIEGREVR